MEDGSCKVPAISFGPKVIANLRLHHPKVGSCRRVEPLQLRTAAALDELESCIFLLQVFFDCHLMVQKPEEQVEAFAEAKAVHPDARTLSGEAPCKSA